MAIAHLSLSRIHFPITAFGPGRRVGIWVQGCSIRCAGCMSRDTWAFSRPAAHVDDLLDGMAPWLGEADGVTISGGEPFDQAGGLLALLAGLRPRFSGDLLVYSGYAFEHLKQQHGEVLALIDALISEPFDAGQPTNAPLRGSANQQLHLLTPLGKARFAAVERAGADAAALDIIAAADGTIWIAGVPRHGDLARLGTLLGGEGVALITSAGRIGGRS